MDYEAALTEIDTQTSFPYWDTSIDSSLPNNSSIWNFFSRDGFNCVSDGILKQNVEILSSHCLKRDIDSTGPSIGTFFDAMTLEALLSNKSLSFENFTAALEVGPVNAFLSGIGGDLSKTFAANDPLFYLFSAWIDKLWIDYQRISPDRLVISGKSKIDLSNPDGTSIQSNDLIPGFNVTVDSMLNIRNLCYIYAPSGSKYIGEYTNTPILTIQKPTSICPVAPPPVSSDTRTLLQLSWKDEFIASKVVQEAYKFTRRY